MYDGQHACIARSNRDLQAALAHVGSFVDLEGSDGSYDESIHAHIDSAHTQNSAHMHMSFHRPPLAHTVFFSRHRYA